MCIRDRRYPVPHCPGPAPGLQTHGRSGSPRCCPQDRGLGPNQGKRLDGRYDQGQGAHRAHAQDRDRTLHD
eukprot:2261343-Alexandrium_andersonii.AAC.1